MTVESTIEKYFVKCVERVGGETFKLQAIGKRGWPDRAAFLPEFGLAFVELKRPKGGKLSEHQKQIIGRLKTFGANVFVLNTKSLIDDFFRFHYPGFDW